MQRWCSLHGISSSVIKCRGSGQKAGPAVHEEHMNRDFTADAINVKWQVGVTEPWTMEGIGLHLRDQGLRVEPVRTLV